MTPTTYTKESPRIAHLGRRLVKKWVSLNRKRSSKPSNHRSTVSNPTIPSSSFATLPPAPDLMEAIQSGQGIHDIVFPPETTKGCFDLCAPDGADLSGFSSSTSNGTGLTDDESESDFTAPDFVEDQKRHSLLQGDREEYGSEQEENATGICVPAVAALLPSSPSSPPPAPSTPNDDIGSIHTSDVDPEPGEKGIEVEITQVEQETESHDIGDIKPSEGTDCLDSWFQAGEDDPRWDSDALELQVLSTPTSPQLVEPDERLNSSDGRMSLILRGFLGAGSYGRVVSADWTEDYEHSVAVKISHKIYISELDFADQGLKRLKEELVILRALNESRENDNLGSKFFPELLKSWQDEKNVYFVMEKYQCNLLNLRGADPDWDASIGDKILWTAEMVLGLQALHRMRILHRDIKPANIFITSDRHIVIGDYGLACHWLDPVYADFPTTSLKARDSYGTLAYLAPEVVKGFFGGPNRPEMRKYATYSFEADIWSLGVTICESWSPISPIRGLFSLGDGESCLDSKIHVPHKILEMDIEPAVKEIVEMHPIWHLIFRMLDRNDKTRIGFSEILSHPVFGHLDWNKVERLEYIPTWSFPELKPPERPERLMGETKFLPHYPVDEMGNRADQVSLLRRAMCAARDWVSQQPTTIAFDALWQHDFDWTAPKVEEMQKWLDVDD